MSDVSLVREQAFALGRAEAPVWREHLKALEVVPADMHWQTAIRCVCCYKRANVVSLGTVQKAALAGRRAVSVEDAQS